MQWLILAAVLYYLFTQGMLPLPGRPTIDSVLYQTLPGGIQVGLPIPEGWAVYRLSDGSQVVVYPNAQTAPGGWVQGTHGGRWVWLNTMTGQLRE